MSRPPVTGELVVVALKAEKLDHKSPTKQDPFCVFRVGDTFKRTKTDVGGGLYPIWDDQVNIPISGSHYELYVQIFDKTNQPNNLMADGVIDLGKVFRDAEHDGYFPLLSRGRPGGVIYLELTFYSAVNQARPQQQVRHQYPPNQQFARPPIQQYRPAPVPQQHPPQHRPQAPPQHRPQAPPQHRPPPPQQSYRPAPPQHQIPQPQHRPSYGPPPTQQRPLPQPPVHQTPPNNNYPPRPNNMASPVMPAPLLSSPYNPPPPGNRPPNFPNNGYPAPGFHDPNYPQPGFYPPQQHQQQRPPYNGYPPF